LSTTTPNSKDTAFLCFKGSERMKALLNATCWFTLISLISPPQPSGEPAKSRYTLVRYSGEDVTITGRGAPVDLRGTCGKLTIENVDEHADIIASQLSAREVVIKEGISGQSVVSVRATGPVRVEGGIDGRSLLHVYGASTVRVLGKIDGESKLYYSNPRGGIVVDGKIDGGQATRVDVRCRQVKFNGGVGDANIWINGRKQKP
jgi:hypothetical protein